MLARKSRSSGSREREPAGRRASAPHPGVAHRAESRGPGPTPECPCGGGCPRCAGAALPVSQPGDPLERAADRLASEALRGEPRALGTLRTAAAQPGLRIHTGREAATTADALDAHAFTVGSDIYFGAGSFAPHTVPGRRLLAHELAHVSQQAQGAPRHVQREGRSPVSVRVPTLELWALRNQEFLSFSGSPLLPDERSTAESVFGSSLDYDAIRIVHSPVIAAPTTFGNTIRVPPAYAIPDHVLIHELTHVWQYQTMGSGYISDSALHQAAAAVGSLFRRGTLDRSGAYRYTIVPGQSFHDYTAEQQAQIVEDYFLDATLQADAEYQRLIGQLRAARPLNVTQAFWEERAAGLPPRQWALPPAVEPFGGEGGGVPQFEFRFPGL